MKKISLFIAAGALSVSSALAQQNITIDFDTSENWTAGSGSISSYQSDHVYAESNLYFTGGRTLRQTDTTQDGFAGALGTYSWRLDDGASTAWTATYTASLASDEYFSGFSFDVRRWDGSPSPSFLVSYSFDGGSSFSVATSIGSEGVIDNTALGDSSNWSTMSQSITSSDALAANQFIVQFADSTGERIMVDNFSVSTSTTPVPEPSTYAAMAGVLVLGLAAYRRRRT